jgi:hypothetical protein
VLDECKVQSSGEIIMKGKTEVLREEPTTYPTWTGVHSRAGFTVKNRKIRPSVTTRPLRIFREWKALLLPTDIQYMYCTGDT